MHQWTVNSKQETKEKEEREEREAAAREERQKEIDEQKERKAAAREERYQNILIQLFDRMAPMNQNRVPQSIENANESALSLSNFTNESNQLIVVSPSTKSQVPKRNNDSLVSIATDEVGLKRKRINVNRDSSGATASTMGLESHSEDHHDPHNGDESAQHHNHQAGLSRQNH